MHCVKSVRIRSYSDPHFLESDGMRENTDQNNTEYGHFSQWIPFLFFLDINVHNVQIINYVRFAVLNFIQF